RAGDLFGDGEGPDGIERTARHRVQERLTADVLDDEIDEAVVRLAEVGDLGDVDVADAIDGPRLAQEAVSLGGVAGEVATEDLHRDEAIDDVVATEIHGGHAAAADARN